MTPLREPFDTSLLETLEGLAHRGYTEGFLRRHTHDDYQNYDTVIRFLTASSLLVSLPVSARGSSRR
ncbi:hypothetical protein ACLK1Z_12135 [Escherichia coli]